MANKMLIDAAHPEETRVAVLRGNKIEEFDFESATRKQLRGNIYLAKVTRVEPSLQAAFVDYGGNRHGFLAFSEIHPDYYQIPVADRQALVEQDAAEDIAEQADDDANDDKINTIPADSENGETLTDKTVSDEDASVADHIVTMEDGETDASDDDDAEATDDNVVESVGAEDALTEIPQRRRSRQRRYKIQEVIKRRQIILVQVVKEERGTKGAALTTYLSLAGRYCVLMPNTARGGGISRKITHATDRRRLKEVARNLDVPEGTGLIIRTAGAKRTKAEIKRDFEYLLRLWVTVRDLTLESSAPCLVYEEGSLIKRSIRDLYNKDVDEVIIDGDEGYKEAKAFMRMLMPSHAKNVKQYKDSHPLFTQHQIESQLDGMFQPRVTLKSGGYLIINQTEALVAVDVNSGRSTREHHIEDTALNTNLEAAEEAARQMRLRDLAGLIVIDFIDMEEHRNNRAVERRLKESLKHDRARIQVGRISHFGLLEMSRQRMRSGVVEGSTQQCPYCQGRGLVRSVESATLFVLRAIEEFLLKNKPQDLVVSAAQDVAFYILNQKRDHLLNLQNNYGITLFINARSDLTETAHEIARAGDNGLANKGVRHAPPAVVPDALVADQDITAAADTEEEENKGKRRRRRRRRGGRNKREHENVVAAESGAETPRDENTTPEASSEPRENDTSDKPARHPRRRRSSRQSREDVQVVQETSASDESEIVKTDVVPTQPVDSEVSSDDAGDKPKPPRRRSPTGRRATTTGRGRRKTKVEADESKDSDDKPQDVAVSEGPEIVAADIVAAPAEAVPGEDDKPAKPKPRRRTRRSPKPKSDKIAAQDGGDAPQAADAQNGSDQAKAPLGNGAKTSTGSEDATPAPAEKTPKPPAEPAGPPRTGWWQRR